MPVTERRITKACRLLTWVSTISLELHKDGDCTGRVGEGDALKLRGVGRMACEGQPAVVAAYALWHVHAVWGRQGAL